jgi:acyl-CoA synthetase (AMP-forming)/AMP-acid ligase II
MGVAAFRAADLLGPGVPVPVFRAAKDRYRPELPGPALLLQSSGTTGAPKMAIRSGASLDAVAWAGADVQGLTPADRVLACIPLSHSYGMENGMLSPVFAGCSVWLTEGFDADEVAHQWHAGVTVFPGVPFMFEALGQRMADGGGAGALRLAYSAGGPMPAGVESRFRAAAGKRIGQLYGATELGLATFGHPDAPGFDPASVGTPGGRERADPRPRGP